MSDPEPRGARKKLIVAYAVSVAAVIAALVYGIIESAAGQSFANDAELVVYAFCVFWFPLIVFLHAPAWILFPSIVKDGSLKGRFLKTLTAGVPLLVPLCLGIAHQWGDWDELLLYLIPFAPSLLVVVWLGVCPPPR